MIVVNKSSFYEYDEPFNYLFIVLVMCFVHPFIIELRMMKTSSGDFPLISEL